MIPVAPASNPPGNATARRAVAPTPNIIAALTNPEPDKTPSDEARRAELPPAKTSSWPAPARFFTINQVLAKRRHAAAISSATRLAAIDPIAEPSDTQAAITPPMQGREPFGLFTFRAPEGLLWTKWRTVESDVRAEAPALTRCRVEPARCTHAEARFAAIIKDAEAHKGRDRLELVNRRINAAIRYTSDIAQWRKPDVWSAPLNIDNKGSFDTGLGDCEDYAIAKYVALRLAGVAAANLRLLLVRDRLAGLDHAVLAVRDDDHWLILDNRWARLLEDRELKQFMPLYALNDSGVKLFAAPYAARPEDKTADTLKPDNSASTGDIVTSLPGRPNDASLDLGVLPLLMETLAPTTDRSYRVGLPT